MHLNINYKKTFIQKATHLWVEWIDHSIHVDTYPLKFQLFAQQSWVLCTQAQLTTLFSVFFM